MKHYYPLLLLLLSFGSHAQTNEGMPMIKDLATHFFYEYEAPDPYSYYDFQKKAEGWFVRFYDANKGTFGQPELYWNKAEQRYLVLDFELQKNPDSAVVAGILAEYAAKFRLTTSDMASFERDLYYGYKNWERDVINTLEKNPPTTDSLWESLANAYDYYSMGYFMAAGYNSIVSQNDDSDRAPLAENLPFSASRLQKMIDYQQKGLDLYKKIYASNPHYRCSLFDIRWRINSEAMTLYHVLKMMGHDDRGAQFLQQVSFPSSVLQKAEKTFQLMKPNSIVIADADTSAFPLEYL
jgi:hypothetical protein